jgi:hypothetical protein
MLPEATISHHTTRRLRIHIPKRKRDTAFFAKIRDELAKCEGVERVEANPSTASVLIHHRSSLGTIAQFAETAKLFAVAVEGTPLSATSLASRMNKGVGKLNAQLVSASQGALDLTSVSAIGLALGGVIRGIVCKSILPTGSDMIWWAVTLLARHDVQMRSATATGVTDTRAEAAPERRKRIRRVRR